jgi:hypothetical protein
MITMTRIVVLLRDREHAAAGIGRKHLTIHEGDEGAADGSTKRDSFFGRGVQPA